MMLNPHLLMKALRPLKNAPVCPIPVPALWNAKPIPLGSDSNFNPRNTQCIPACPVGPADRTGVVKIFAFLELEPRLNIKTDITGQAKLSIFQGSHIFCTRGEAPKDFFVIKDR